MPFVRVGWRRDSADCLYRTYGHTLVGEGKTVAMGAAGDYGPDGTDQVPDRVTVQALWHLAHWPQAEACLVPVLIGGFTFEFRCYRIARAGNEDVIANILSDAHRFHTDYVAKDMPPPASAGDDDALRHLYPRHIPGHWAAATPEARRMADEYTRARAEEKIAHARKSAAAAALKQHIGHAEGFDDGQGVKVLWRRRRSRRRLEPATHKAWRTLSGAARNREVGREQWDTRRSKTITSSPHATWLRPCSCRRRSIGRRKSARRMPASHSGIGYGAQWSATCKRRS